MRHREEFEDFLLDDDLQADVYAGCHEALNAAAASYVTLPSGQRVRPEWPKAFADLVLIFDSVRSSVIHEKQERAIAQAQARAHASPF